MPPRNRRLAPQLVRLELSAIPALRTSSYFVDLTAHRPAEHAAANGRTVGSAQLAASSHGPLAWHADSALAAHARVPAVYSPHRLQQPFVPTRNVPTSSQSVSFEHESSTGG
jgi:hypothetical protein